MDGLAATARQSRPGALHRLPAQQPLYPPVGFAEQCECGTIGGSDPSLSVNDQNRCAKLVKILIKGGLALLPKNILQTIRAYPMGPAGVGNRLLDPEITRAK